MGQKKHNLFKKVERIFWKNTTRTKKYLWKIIEILR